MEGVSGFGFTGIAGRVLLLVGVCGLLAACATPLEKYRKEGVRLYNAKQYDESMKTLELALKEDRFDAVSNAYEGMIYYQRGEYERAEYNFRVALNADPSSEVAKEGLTETLIKKGKPDDALDALERAAKMAEKVDDPRIERTFKRPYTKQVEERLFLGKVDDRVRIARSYQKLGDYDNALVYYKKALELSEEDVKVLMAVADMSEKAGNKAQAKEYLARAYRKAPGTPGLTEAMTRNGLAISDVMSPR
jgi:tetratricopeptide (TPR) repeat protein